MDNLAEHKRILELVESNQLPRQIDEKSDVSVAVFRELYESGLVDGADARSMDGDAFLEPRITMPGRQYLAELRQQAAEASPAGKAKWVGGRLLVWAGGIAGAVIAGAILLYFGPGG